MKLFIDDADCKEIRRLLEWYPIDGVTTNPTILARTGRNPVAVLKEIREIIGENRLLFAQVIPKDADGMVKDGMAIQQLLGKNTVVKVAVVPEGLKAIQALHEEGVVTCGTVVYTPLQALLAAKAGAEYVAPYVNRIDNMGYDGIGTVRQIQNILQIHHFKTQVLAASFKNSQQVLSLCSCGIENATCSPSVIDGLIKNLTIESAVDGFTRDFAVAYGEGISMADLIL